MLKQLAILLTNLAVNALALLVVDRLFDGIWFDSPGVIIAAAAALALVNAYLRPLIVTLTLPVSCLTLGAFTLVINAGMFKLVSWLIPSFHVEGFWTATGGALALSIVSGILNWLLRPREERVRMRRL
jgi:putative membrane protein